MSRASEIIQSYYERYPDAGLDDTPDRYEREHEQLRRYLQLTDTVMAGHGVDEDTRAVIVRDVLYGAAGDPAEQQRRAGELQPRVSTERWSPPGEGSGWTGAFPVTSPGPHPLPGG